MSQIPPYLPEFTIAKLSDASIEEIEKIIIYHLTCVEALIHRVDSLTLLLETKMVLRNLINSAKPPKEIP